MQARTKSVTGVGFSPLMRFDDNAPSYVSVQCDVTGTATYTLQTSLDDPNDPISPTAVGSMIWINSSDVNAVGATTSIQTNFAFAPKFARVQITSGTGTVAATFLQSSSGPE
jgi:hypothetical protein